ncbi:unnamed protein product [Protopolystoma xenopodis]|uniref:Uncharacterized protein n=1 Tax=Protopolystoma xenopodis TaxID=117903 RepID=A0A448X591_9PLAT|nr:unnamed protein product [Protopolystoma xenopodis]
MLSHEVEGNFLSFFQTLDYDAITNLRNLQFSSTNTAVPSALLGGVPFSSGDMSGSPSASFGRPLTMSGNDVLSRTRTIHEGMLGFEAAGAGQPMLKRTIAANGVFWTAATCLLVATVVLLFLIGAIVIITYRRRKPSTVVLNGKTDLPRCH